MIIKLGRSGKFMSCSRYPDCDGALTMDGQEVGKEKPFGIHPTTGENIYLLTGRFGAYVQQGETPEKPKLTKFPKGHKKTAEDKELIKKEKELIEQAKELPMPRRASLPPKMKASDVTRNRFLDCEKAMQITNETQFLLWLGIDIEDEAFENIYFEIITPKYRNASTEIAFDDYDEMFEDRIEVAVEKFNSLIRDIIDRIEADIDYRFTDEAIIGDIEANDYEFLSNGKKY